MKSSYNVYCLFLPVVVCLNVFVASVCVRFDYLKLFQSGECFIMISVYSASNAGTFGSAYASSVA